VGHFRNRCPKPAKSSEKAVDDEDYPVVDKLWVNGLSPCELPFDGDPKLLAVHKPAARLRDGVEGGNSKGGSTFKGQLCEVYRNEILGT